MITLNDDKLSKGQLIKKINKCNNLDKALEIINQIHDKRVVYDSDVFFKLIMLGDDFDRCNELIYDYTKEVGIKRRDFIIYKALLMKSPTFSIAEKIFNEMKNFNMPINITIYGIISKKIANKDDALRLNKLIKTNYAFIDAEVLKNISDKLIGTKEYHNIQYERYCITKTIELSSNLDTRLSIHDFNNMLENSDIELNSYIYALCIYHIEDMEFVKKIIKSLLDLDMYLDSYIVVAVLERMKKCKDDIELIYLFENVYSKVSNDNKIEINKATTYLNNKLGGLTQFLLEQDRLANKYEEKMLTLQKLEDKHFYMGKIFQYKQKYDINFNNVMNNIDYDIACYETEEDKELFHLELCNLKGRKEALLDISNLYNEIKLKNIPILYINYIEDKKISSEIILDFYSKGIIRVKNIEEVIRNSFYNVFSLEEMLEVLKKLNYQDIDIRITFYGMEMDSCKLMNKSKENQLLMNEIDSFLEGKICFRKYVQVSKKI